MERLLPLPDAIVEEIQRVANRVEIHFGDVKPEELPAAALVESPIYRGGEQLEPWQRAFVTIFLKHRETYRKARLLLADEVGLGKTLSLAASAMISALLDDGPVLILSLYAHASVAGGTKRQARHSERGVALRKKGVGGPQRPYD